MHAVPSADDAKLLLDALAAAPRGAGTEGEARARALCVGRLEAAGFAVREAPFTYSSLPGRWATPIAGVGVLVLTSVAGHLGYGGRHGWSLVVLMAGLLAIGAFALWSARRGVLDAPLGRAVATNLVAMPPGAPSPEVWLVAHLDSKSQPVSIGLRAAAIVLAVVACLALLVLATAGLAGARWAAAGQATWQLATIVGWIAAVPIALTTTRAGSRPWCSPPSRSRATCASACCSRAPRSWASRARARGRGTSPRARSRRSTATAWTTRARSP
jgi:hypothetical protein